MSKSSVRYGTFKVVAANLFSSTEFAWVAKKAAIFFELRFKSLSYSSLLRVVAAPAPLAIPTYFFSICSLNSSSKAIYPICPAFLLKKR